MKVAELTGALLNYWVARADDHHDARVIQYVDHGLERSACLLGLIPYSPSTEWRFGGPIIERERIALRPGYGGGHLWKAERSNEFYDEQPLIAAMRAYVASKFGDEVPDTIETTP